MRGYTWHTIKQTKPSQTIQCTPHPNQARNQLNQTFCLEIRCLFGAIVTRLGGLTEGLKGPGRRKLKWLNLFIVWA